ncbi:MAG: FAD-binding oxidoreductase, partial [Burkholderiales bacterium]
MGKPESFTPLIDKAALVAKLREILPSDGVLAASEDLKPFETDGLTAYRQTPLIVVLPETEVQVQKILKLCHANNVPVVARG